MIEVYRRTHETLTCDNTSFYMASSAFVFAKRFLVKSETVGRADYVS